MKGIASLLAFLLVGCSAVSRNPEIKDLEGKYVSIIKGGDFYKELTLELNQDNTFLFGQRLGPEGFVVRGTVNFKGRNMIELTVEDTTSLLRKEPIFKGYYNVKNVALVLKNKKIKLYGKTFRRVRR